MAVTYDGAIQNVIDAFAKLPGIGPKGAQRIAFHILGIDDEEAAQLAESIVTVREKIRFCEICGNVCESSPCPICSDPRRDRTVICVVQEPKDVMSIERTHEFHGLYHVLGGAIDPMANVGPNDLAIPQLLNRLKSSNTNDSEADEVDREESREIVKEVVLALNPDIEGEATTTYLARLLAPVGIEVTRLASGLPVGGDLEYADEVTLGRALTGRHAV